MPDNFCNSASAVMRAQEKERAEQKLIREEREFDKKVSLETLNELKAQRDLFRMKFEESQIELKNSRKYNRIMLAISLVSVAIAIASLIVAIVK